MMSRLTSLVSCLLVLFLSGCGDETPTGSDDPINDDTFAITIGGENNETAFGMVATSDGGIVMVGSRETDIGIYHGLVVKVDATGTVLWEKLIDSHSSQRFADVVSLTNGDLVVLGSAQQDFNVVRLDPSGAVIWDKLVNVRGGDDGVAVTATSGGDIVFVGNTLSALTNIDNHVARLDGNGNVIWSHTFDNSALDAAYDITATDDGGFVITSQSGSLSGGPVQFHIFKVDAAGTEVWSKHYGSPYTVIPAAARTTPDGRIIVSGSSASSGGTNHDIHILELDANGERISEFRLETPASEIAHSMLLTPSGDVIVAGNINTNGGDVLLVQAGLDGTLVWNRSHGMTLRQNGNDVVLIGDRLYTCGISQSSDFDDDIYLIRTDLNGQL